MPTPCWPRPAALALVLLLPRLDAQQPAPAAEPDSATWSAEEGSLLFVMRANLRHVRESTDKPARFGGRAIQIDGYSLGFFVPGETGDAELAVSVAHDQPVFALAWPRAATDDTRRGILVHKDGTTLFCEAEGADLPEFGAGLALAKGGQGKFADALRQPGTGGKGHLWLWLSQTGFEQSVQVVDGQGNPRAGVVVDVTGDGKAQRQGALTLTLPKPLPLAQGTTDRRGFVVLRGPRCRATVALLYIGTMLIVASRVTVEDTPAGLRFVVPDDALVSAAVNANESAAIATLKNISSAQAQCQAGAAIDTNSNGAGEYGFFGELTGTIAVRSDAKGGVGQMKINPPVLSRAFAKVTQSRAERSGYLFQIFLPGAECQATAEAATGGGADVAVDSRKAEALWCCYAWPASPASGLRAFFVNQAGDVTACDNKARYCGHDQPPAPTAAFGATTSGALDATIAANVLGRDGQRWVVVN